MPSREGSPPPPVGGRSSSEMVLSSKEHKENPLPTVSTSATTPHVTSNKTHIHKSNSKTHVVGHNRGHHTRVPSYGKNLNKLSKLSQPAAAAGVGGGTSSGTVKQHRRTHSDTSSTSQTSQQAKRVGSSTSLDRTGSHVSLKKNASKSNLVNLSQKKRAESTGLLNGKEKGVEGEATTNAKNEGQQQPRHPVVHFDLKDSEEDDSSNPDADWTEVSNSDSPSKTRTNSANNSNNSSEVASPEQVRVGQVQPTHPVPPSPPPSPPPPRSQDRVMPSQTEGQQPSEITSIPRNKPTTPKRPTTNHQHQAHSSSSPLLTNTITSRLLRRHPTPKAAPPKMSVVSATDSSRTLVESTASSASISAVVAGSTPGNREHVVSRFLPGSGGSHNGTPAEGEEEIGSISPVRPNFSHRHQTEEDEDNIPPSPTPSHQPLPSRMQQKLWLQRASSTIEPHPPTQPNSHPHNPRPHDPHHPQLNGIHHPIHGGGVGNDMMTGLIQKESERAVREYKVVRRNFDPVRDSILRLRGRGGVLASSGGGGGSGAGGGNVRTGVRGVVGGDGGGEDNDDDGGDDGEDNNNERHYTRHGRDSHASQTQSQTQARDNSGNNNNNNEEKDGDDGGEEEAEEEEDKIEAIKRRMWGL